MNNNLLLAVIASIRAGEAIMEVYSGPFDIELKGDESPLTEADKKANDVINNGGFSMLPNFGDVHGTWDRRFYQLPADDTMKIQVSRLVVSMI